MAKLMGEELKLDLAQELGVRKTVLQEGWGSVSSRNCGRLVQLAIRRAETLLRDR